jgi:hypothetical protein
MTPLRGAAATLVVLALAVPAFAQAERPGISVAAGAGSADPLHGDFAFRALAWGIDVRVGRSPHVMIEGVANGWHHVEESIRLNQPIQGPSGVIGVIGRLTQRTGRDISYVGVNLLGTGAAGRLRLNGGAGAGLMFFRRNFSQVVVDCVSASPQVCQSFATRDRDTTLGLQATGGADVSVAAHFGVFGQVRASLPYDDPGSGDVSVIVGLRIK